MDTIGSGISMTALGQWLVDTVDHMPLSSSHIKVIVVVLLPSLAFFSVRPAPRRGGWLQPWQPLGALPRLPELPEEHEVKFTTT
jgi:hypothetical protein